MGILKITREFKAPGAGKEHTNEVRGGGRDPGVRRPGAGLPTARSKFFREFLTRRCKAVKGEIQKFIIRQPPMGGKDDYDSENSWIPDGLPSSSRRRRRGGGRWEVGEWREK